MEMDVDGDPDMLDLIDDDEEPEEELVESDDENIEQVRKRQNATPSCVTTEDIRNELERQKAARQERRAETAHLMANFSIADLSYDGIAEDDEEEEGGFLGDLEGLI